MILKFYQFNVVVFYLIIVNSFLKNNPMNYDV